METDNHLQMAVVDIVADVLGCGRVDPSSSFWDFGGTSLQAIRICWRIQTALGVRVPEDVLFNSTTMRDFTETVVAYLHQERT